jgi:tRNA(Ile)-lysidine synthase
VTIQALLSIIKDRMKDEKQKETLEQKVLGFIRKNRLIQSGEKILVAVSGGPDSVSLLYILNRLHAELAVTLYIAHLNHQLREQEADRDAQYVADLARSFHIPATIGKRDVIRYQAEHKISLEEAAREVRYCFLAETARSLGIEKVAVGHNQNDQVETILLHIIRGTGTQGLRGLQPSRSMKFVGYPLTVIRPLLNIKREEIEKYCARLRLTPCVDTSNYSLSILRNRVRLELLPLLQSYNPGVTGSLLRIGNVAGDELALLEAETHKIWSEIARKEENVLILDKAGLLKLAPALQRQVLREAVRELIGTLRDIEARHIEEILQALRKPAGKQIIFPEGLVFSIEYNRYLFGKNPERLNPFPQLKGEFDIVVPGKTRVPGWTIEATVSRLDESAEGVLEGNDDLLSACFDKIRVGDKIKMRTRLRGDRFQPLGMAQEKRLGEFMIDARIPKDWRDRIPIFFTPQQIIWLAGWRIDERVKVTENTQNVLCLKITKDFRV